MNLPLQSQLFPDNSLLSNISQVKQAIELIIKMLNK